MKTVLQRIAPVKIDICFCAWVVSMVIITGYAVSLLVNFI